MDDRQLLVRYATEGSDDAFRELVRRHMGLVYSAALRQVNNPQLAQDVTQVVFANLARKARSIPADAVLAGWLHRDTRFTALDFLRAEIRRSKREQQAAEMNALESTPAHTWEQMRPLLDEALDELGPADRDALLLRYFEQRDYAGVGAVLGASADAARKRVDRALDRLREHLVKRGITTTSAALGAALTTHAVEAVPAAFATALTAGSTAAAVAAGTTWFANFLLMTKTKLAVGSALLAAALATPLIVQQQAIAGARADRLALEERVRNAAGSRPSESVVALPARPNSDAQQDRADLERLRREAADLRARLAQLAVQGQNEIAAREKEKATEAASSQNIDVAGARNVGNGSPADMVQTFVWALSNNQTNFVAQLVASDVEADLDKLLGRAFPTLKSSLIDTLKSFGCTGFQIQRLESTDNSDQLMVVDLLTPGGPVGQPAKFRIRATVNGWKLVISADGQPIQN